MDSLLENYGWILVLLIFVAPLVVLWWVVRRVRRWWQARAQPNAVAASPEPRTAEVSGGGYSFPFGIPLVVYPLLLIVIVRGAGQLWGIAAHIAYLILVEGFLYLAFSRARFEITRAGDPSLTRATWILNWLLFFVLLPLAAWLFFGLPTLLR